MRFNKIGTGIGLLISGGFMISYGAGIAWGQGATAIAAGIYAAIIGIILVIAGD